MYNLHDCRLGACICVLKKKVGEEIQDPSQVSGKSNWVNHDRKLKKQSYKDKVDAEMMATDRVGPW